MSRRGVWQLHRLALHYCDWSGSSRGARDFIQAILPRFRAANPHLQVDEVLRRGQHPFLEAQYPTGQRRSVDVAGQCAEEVLRQAVLLRSSAGRKASLQVKQRLRSARPSVQGRWTPDLQERLRREGPAAAAAARAGD